MPTSSWYEEGYYYIGTLMKYIPFIFAFLFFSCSSDDNNSDSKADLGDDMKTVKDMGADEGKKTDAQMCCTQNLCEMSGKFCNTESCQCEAPTGCTTEGGSCDPKNQDSKGFTCLEKKCVAQCDFFGAAKCSKGTCQIDPTSTKRDKGNIVGYCLAKTEGSASTKDLCDGKTPATTCDDKNFCVEGVCRVRCDAFAKAGANGECEATKECFITVDQIWGTCRSFCSPWNETTECKDDEMCFPDAIISGVGECREKKVGPIAESAACDIQKSTMYCKAALNCVDGFCRKLCDVAQNGGGQGACHAPRSCRELLDNQISRKYGYCG